METKSVIIHGVSFIGKTVEGNTLLKFPNGMQIVMPENMVTIMKEDRDGLYWQDNHGSKES